MRPVLVGPWLGEVGFELLYWIPYLRQRLRGVPREHIWVISRGGCRSWYQDFSAHYLELYDWYSPTALAALNMRRVDAQGAQGRQLGLRRGQRTAKQLYVSPLEAPIVTRACREVGEKQPTFIHPSAMYAAFRPYWHKRQSDKLLEHWQLLTRSACVRGPSAPVDRPLRYVAVKFYASEACADQPTQRAIVQQVVRAIAETTDVVLLHTGTAYDEHGEFVMPDHPRIHRQTFTPGRNLDEQTALIAGASAFVGTYGGFAYLAPFVSVPTIALYATANFRQDHLRLMMHVATRDLRTAFRPVALRDGLATIRREQAWWRAPHAA